LTPDPLAASERGFYSSTSKGQGRKGDGRGEKRAGWDCLLFIQLLATGMFLIGVLLFIA